MRLRVSRDEYFSEVDVDGNAGLLGIGFLVGRHRDAVGG